jgi:hypothetical protein
MRTSIKRMTPWRAALAIGTGVALAPVASAATHTAPLAAATAPTVPSAGTDPLVPYGTDPVAPYLLGYVNSNHDEANTTNGGLDLPF